MYLISISCMYDENGSLTPKRYYIEAENLGAAKEKLRTILSEKGINDYVINSSRVEKEI